jgi:hypothetical protein
MKNQDKLLIIIIIIHRIYNELKRVFTNLEKILLIKY